MDILFWSGGKDSYLALEFYRRDYPGTDLKLLTTFDKETGLVPHQNIPISQIRDQAEELELELITVGLPERSPNELYLEQVCKALNGQEQKVNNLVFGDWKLEDIREWREKEFGKRGWDCLFPIWKKSLHELMPVLMFKPVEIKISSVQPDYQKYLRVGEEYTLELIQQLTTEIDPMGENGEFHTVVIFKNNNYPK